MKKTKELYKNSGHRSRLRDRFLQDGLDGFLDYEVIELLLTLRTPLKDCKPMAKEAIKVFGSLQGVLDASSKELQRVKGIGPINIYGLKLFQAISERYAKNRIPRKISLESQKLVEEYLCKKLGKEKKEHFMVLLLDSCNNLIKISDISVGILNASIIHPREIFKEAIEYSSAQIILAHNHPSGSLEPSEADLITTKRIVEAGKLMGIEVIDHFIISKTDSFSFKENKLI